jgi:hypothetical protein
MKHKYGVTKNCKFCGNLFSTRPRFLLFCSTVCKNPLNRGEYEPWNKGIKLSTEQKSKQNLSGLKKGHGWNKGKKNVLQSIRWKENNPNADGKLNNLRPKKSDSVRTEFQIYKSEVRKTTYRTIKKLKADGHFLPKFGKYKTDYQIDHIVSIKQGFELGIPAALLGDIKNIQFLKAHDNRAKWHANQSMAFIRIIKGKYYGIQQ